eukprot:gene3406-13450_t
MSSYMDKGNVLIENATSTDRVALGFSYTPPDSPPGCQVTLQIPSEDERWCMSLTMWTRPPGQATQTAADETLTPVPTSARFEESLRF